VANRIVTACECTVGIQVVKIVEVLTAI